MPEERTEKAKAIDLALARIDKLFGKGSSTRRGMNDICLGTTR